MRRMRFAVYLRHCTRVIPINLPDVNTIHGICNQIGSSTYVSQGVLVTGTLTIRCISYISRSTSPVIGGVTVYYYAQEEF